MKILAVNTSGFSAAIAFSSDEPPSNATWLCQDLEKDQKAAQYLVPAIHSLLASQNTEIGEIDLFAVASGPGSFTGLRIGMTTLKTLAYATSSPITGVNSLAATAQNACRNQAWGQGKLTVAMNAFRQQVFVATFEHDRFPEQSIQGNSMTQLIAATDLPEFVDNSGSLLAVAGDGLAGPNLDILDEKIIHRDSEQNVSAIGVGEIGWRQLNQKMTSDPMTLLPSYFRGSAAEEKLRDRP